METLLERLRQRARSTGGRIALPEATDPRVLGAAVEAARSRLVEPVLVGERGAIEAAARDAGLELRTDTYAVDVVDPRSDSEFDALAARFAEIRASRGANPDTDVRELAANPLYYACLLVDAGRVDGAVMGAVVTTADTLRAALRTLGVDPRYSSVTSCFLMELPDGRTFVYADCGVIPAPTPEQLAEIAMQAADACRALVEVEPRVALLAFSTKGSAQHASLEPVRRAVEILEDKKRQGAIDFDFDGELQGDAALVPNIAERKAPDSSVAGRSNVLVFPDLNSGNIAYKLTERLAGARAVGPLLQGLARPVHDLSRGCSMEDILDTMVITALDAARPRERRKS